MIVHVLGCWGAYPAPGEATAGYLIEAPGGKVLLDCGSGVLAQLFKICALEDLAAVLVTHHHHDHAADLGPLGYAVLLARLTGRARAPLTVCLPAGNPRLEEEFRQEPGIALHRIDALSRVQVAGMEVSFARTAHPVECLAVRMEAAGKVFVFSADSSLCPELERIAAGADLFLCEASLPDGMEADAARAGHLTAGQAGRVARAAGVRRLALTHYPHGIPVQQLLQQAGAAFGKPAERVHTLQRLDV